MAEGGVCLEADGQERSGDSGHAEPEGQRWGRHYSLPLEVRDAEEHLDHRVEVAAVTEVPDACVAGPEQGLQWHT